MHLDEPLAAGAPVQAVHVLGHEEEAVAHPRLGLGERGVAGVRAHGAGLAPPLGVEAPDEPRVLLEALGRRHLLDRVVLPEAVRVAEGRHAALGGDAGAGQDEEPRVAVDLQAHADNDSLVGEGGVDERRDDRERSR